MEQSQWYIGTPNGVVMCVDSRQEHQFQGRLYHAYSREGKRFGTMEQLLTLLEQFYNWMNFPYPGTDDRSFTETGKERIRSNHAAERTKIMKDEELLSRHGELGTFVIRVQHRQNSSWQGRITWMDKNKTVCFRSVWELIKLVDGALDTVCSEEDSQDEVSWTEDREWEGSPCIFGLRSVHGMTENKNSKVKGRNFTESGKFLLFSS